ncbi:MAG: hypothetical protein ACLFSB_11315 [Chitinispirillaceae bacterium]
MKNLSNVPDSSWVTQGAAHAKKCPDEPSVHFLPHHRASCNRRAQFRKKTFNCPSDRSEKIMKR